MNSIDINFSATSNPSIFVVETVLGCNLRCPGCAVGSNQIQREKGMMSFDQYKIIADKIRPFAKSVCLINWGEPLLNADIFRMIHYTSTFAQTTISTNGMLINAENAKKLIEAGAHSIIVSIDGTTQEVYEKYRVGGSFNKAFNALKFLNNENIRQGNITNLVPQFIVFKHNQHQMDDFKKICNSIGLVPSFKSPYFLPNTTFSNSQYKEYSRSSFSDEVSRKKAMRECRDPKEVMTIFLDGSVVPCCHARDADVSFGNIFEQKLLNIWNGTKYLEFRNNHIMGNISSFCSKNCMQYVLSNMVQEVTPTIHEMPIPCINLKESRDHKGESIKNPNNPEFFNKLYNGLWDLNGFVQPYEYEEATRIDFYQQLARLPFFSGEGNMLDVGCGMDGIFSNLPPENKFIKYGIDFSQVAIEKTQRRIPGGTFIVGDVHNLPYEKNFFHRLICTETLEHVDRPSQVVSEICRVMQPHGKLLVTVPEASRDISDEHWPGGVSVHINKFSIESLSDMIKSTDFIVDSVDVIGNDIWLIATKTSGSRTNIRLKKHFELKDLGSDISVARELYSQGHYNEAFDLYEQLADTHIPSAVAILAEAYDQFETLPNKDDRYHLYQSRYFDFALKSSDKVLDVGSGNLPFPFATHLADLSIDDATVGRAGVPFKYLDGKPVYECNIEKMPFVDKEFDFVYCSHVLEHVNNPELACQELMRIARRGYIETPTRGKDLWLNTTEISNHKWAVELINDKIIFTEYTLAEVHGFGCDILMNMHCLPQTLREKAFSALIYLKAPHINTMFCWDESFRFEVRHSIPFTNVDNVEVSNATWQMTMKRSSVKLYAGDIPKMIQYTGWIGLSITKGDECHILHDLTSPFPIPDNSVDAFQAEDVLEHISYEQLLPVLNEIFRVLKPNALFRLSVPDYGCDVLQERSVKDSLGNIVFDPGGGGTRENPGHIWFPRIDTVRELISKSLFAQNGRVDFLHYYNMDGSFVVEPVDYSKGHVDRTPDFDERVKFPYRPMSMIIDLVKMTAPEPESPLNVIPRLTISVALPAANDNKKSCLFINTYYEGFLGTVYSRQEGLVDKPYKEQLEQLLECNFGDSDFYSEGLKNTGWSAADLIVNCDPLQQAWARENECICEGMALVVEQVKHARPDCIYLQNLGIGTKELLAAVRPYTDLIVGQIAYPLPEQTDLSGFDIIFSSFPHFTDRFRSAGVTAYYQPLAFEPRVLKSITKFAYGKRPVDCSFVGGISPMHGKGYHLLENLAANVPIHFWGYGVETLPPDSGIRASHHGEVWGKEMFYLLGASKITINRHIDVAENYANNMRLFEATGCGALLITDYKDNLHELFEIGKEVVAYRSTEECIELIKYYLAHPDEAETIARAGQARTLREHTYVKRMEQTTKILSRHQRYHREQGTLAIPERISDSYRTITIREVTPELESAWKNPDIPLQQRALVQQQLHEMYRGSTSQMFKVLSDLLLPLAYEGISVLEIGCASGYYYEVLEYLLKKQVTYTGIDYSEAMIDLARDYYPDAHFFAADGANLPIADRSFQVVVSGGVLLHTLNYDQHIAETARVAKQWIVVHRTPICLTRSTTCSSKMAYGIETVEFRFCEQELLSLFEQHGFKLIRKCVYLEKTEVDEYEASYLLERIPQPTTLSPAPSSPVRPAPDCNRPVVLVSRAIAFTFPLSYAYLAGQLRAQGEEVRVLFKDIPPKALVKQIMELKPLIVGFGNLYPELEETRLLIRLLDEAGRQFPIVIGGQMVSPTPEFAVRVTGADFGIIGEGELILLELVQKLRAGLDVSDIKGLVVRRGNDIKSNGPGAFIENLSTGLPAIPYDLFPTDQWLPIGAWYAKNFPVPHWKIEDRVINVHGGRGCPFTCNFCYHHSKARYRDISVMMDEAQEALIRFDGNMPYFSDDLVMLNPKRARELIEAIGRLDRPVAFQVSTRFDILANMDDGLLRDLKKIGCRNMGLGLESGSDRILKLMGKNCTVSQIEEGLERLRMVGIYPAAAIMVGQNSETLEDVKASIALMQRLVKKDPYLSLAFTLTTPFPGSSLYNLIFQQGLLKDDQEFYDRYFATVGEFKQVVNLSSMSDNEVTYAFSELQRLYDLERQNHII